MEKVQIRNIGHGPILPPTETSPTPYKPKVQNTGAAELPKQSQDKLRIYVAGPITSDIKAGVPPDEVRSRFEAAADRVRALGYEPVLPPDLMNFGKGWVQCMKDDIPVLLSCEGIYLMHGWQNSRGAVLERQIAQALGMIDFYEGAE